MVLKNKNHFLPLTRTVKEQKLAQSRTEHQLFDQRALQGQSNDQNYFDVEIPALIPADKY